MKLNTLPIRIFTPFILILLSTHFGFSQGAVKFPNNQELQEIILQHDRDFWEAYNQCDVDGMIQFITDDLEFYHDKNGFTTGIKEFEESLRNGLCAKGGNRTRREAVEGTVEVYPLEGFGAIILGKHFFFETQAGKPERRTGIAQFTHVWKLEGGHWKMSRVLSFDHKAPPKEAMEPKILVSEQALGEYVGSYEAPETGTVVFSIKEGTLEMQAGKMTDLIYADSKDVFVHPQAPLSFEFVRNDEGKVIKMIVREGGEIAEEAIRKD